MDEYDKKIEKFHQNEKSSQLDHWLDTNTYSKFTEIQNTIVWHRFFEEKILNILIKHCKNWGKLNRRYISTNFLAQFSDYNKENLAYRSLK